MDENERKALIAEARIWPNNFTEPDELIRYGRILLNQFADALENQN